MATVESTGFTISEAAAATGMSTHTLRYYERAGLMLDAVERAASTQRRYSDLDLRWLELLGRLRQTGMPIRQIRAYAGLVRAGDGNEEARLALLESHRDQVLARLRETERNLEAIDAKVELYHRLVDR